MVEIDLDITLEYDIKFAEGADFVFNVHAAKTAHQAVQSESLTLTQDVTSEIATDTATASRFVRLHAGPGPFALRYQAHVIIDHHLADPDTLDEVPVRCLPLEVMPYIYPSRYCQSDRLLKFAMTEFGELYPGYSRILAIQHWVQRRVAFTSNSTDSTTSAMDTLVDGVGVCRDFAHLMIAMCRALNVPARVVTGTDYGADPILGPPDFHAYVEVYLGDRWYLFDPSGTGIPMGFVRLGTGRDAADVAFATIFGAVDSKAPLVRVTTSDANGAVLPHHRREALSTMPASPPAESGCIKFDSKALVRVKPLGQVKQVPN